MPSDLDSVSVFLAVAELRSFRAAAQRLGVTGSAVSQTVRDLEARVGVALLQRTTRSVALTEAGEQLYASARPALADVRATLAALEEHRRRPAGMLRLNVSSIAESFLGSGVLAEFLAAYPDITLDVVIDDEDRDLVAHGFDAGVRLGEVIDADMVAVSVSAPQRQVVVGTPAYFARRGTPRHPRDLLQHDCVGWRPPGSTTPYRWEFTEKRKEFEVAVEPRVRTNDMLLMVRLALDGVGLSTGMEETFRVYLERKQLVTVLDAFCEPFPGFFLCYPKQTQTPSKLRALSDFLRKRMKAARTR